MALFQFRTKYAHDAQPTDAAQSYPAGFYPAKIIGSEEKYSKAGRPMLQLTLEVDAGGPKTVDIKEYLLLEATSAWKVEQYLAAIGMQFAEGQDISIDERTFLGGKLYLLTCNEPGVTNPDRLFLKPMKAFRKADIPHAGPLTDAELESWGLNRDGTRKGDRSDQRANAQTMAQPQQNAWGAQPQPMRPQQGAWGQQQAPVQQPVRPVEENLADDDIPF
jgi:hypothetical protein